MWSLILEYETRMGERTSRRSIKSEWEKWVSMVSIGNSESMEYKERRRKITLSSM